MHLEGLVGDQAVGLSVDAMGGVGGLDQAEDLAGALVGPVPEVLDAVGVLLVVVGRVRSPAMTQAPVGMPP